MSLYDILVIPVVSYGAQVSGPDFIILDFESAMVDPMVQAQRAFMRSLVGARSPATVSLHSKGHSVAKATLDPLGQPY